MPTVKLCTHVKGALKSTCPTKKAGSPVCTLKCLYITSCIKSNKLINTGGAQGSNREPSISEAAAHRITSQHSSQPTTLKQHFALHAAQAASHSAVLNLLDLCAAFDGANSHQLLLDTLPDLSITKTAFKVVLLPDWKPLLGLLG